MTTEPPKLTFGDTTYEQPELPLEWPVYKEYLIELRRGSSPGEMEVVRHNTARTAADAVGLIEGLRDRASFKDNVEWRDQEVDGKGDLFGLAKGVVWQIHVTPDLNTELG
jgi:hypothetical protein